MVHKDVEEEHIAADVQPSGVQKHSGDQGEVDQVWCVKREMRWHSWERRLRDTMCQRHRYNRIGEHECRSFRSKRYLVEKYSHVYSDEPPRYPGKASSWSCVVLDRNHTFPLHYAISYIVLQPVS